MQVQNREIRKVSLFILSSTTLEDKFLSVRGYFKALATKRMTSLMNLRNQALEEIQPN